MANATFNFSTLLGGGTSGFNLGDYAAIKNGSYRKLLGAYYKSLDSSSTSKTKTRSSRYEVKNEADRYGTSEAKAPENTEKKDLIAVQNKAVSLKNSTDKLMGTSVSSVFDRVVKENDKGETSYDYDREAIYQSVKSFVSNYNSAVGAGSVSTSANVTRTAKTMVNQTEAKRDTLSAVGISIGADNKLSIDADKFKSADMETVRSLFDGDNSYGAKISSQAALMNTYAKSAAAVSSIYTQGAKYSYYDYSSMFSTNA